MQLGYACVNMSLKTKFRTCNLKNSTDSKILTDLSNNNIEHLMSVLKYNFENQINFYRIPEIIPWKKRYDWDFLENPEKIKYELRKAGDYSKYSGQRIECHPGPFNILVSDRPNVISETVSELTSVGEIFDVMGFERNWKYPINIHIGRGKPNNSTDYKILVDRFVNSWKILPDTVTSRLVFENDDKPNCWSIESLLQLRKDTGILFPITVDFFHHQLHSGTIPLLDLIPKTIETWHGFEPVYHFSDSKKKFEDPLAIQTAHSDWVHTELPTELPRNSWVMLEVKQKNKALLEFRKKFLK